jgi:hypothetical protein
VIVAALLGAVGSSDPIAQVIVFVPEQEPTEDVAETSVNPSTSVSVTVTPAAEDCPLFLTVSVKVTFSVARTGFGDAVLIIDKSADG